VRLSLIATVIALVGHSATAFGYCQATTCDGSTGKCAEDEHGCATVGEPLQWKGGSVALQVDKRGSILRNLSAEDTQGAVETALSTWMNADCDGGGHPSFAANTVIAPDLSADFVPKGPYESDILYADEKWPYEAGAIAKTLLGFTLDTGDILDADIVLNSADFPLSLEPKATDVDLAAVLTHEIGHVLGLGHSDAPGATMQKETRGFATAQLLTLEPDDMNGICAIYPPGAVRSKTNGSSPSDSSSDASNTGGGCAVSPGSRGVRAPWVLAVATLFGFAGSRRRRRTMPRQVHH
jgi:hypothetical protein